MAIIGLRWTNVWLDQGWYDVADVPELEKESENDL